MVSGRASVQPPQVWVTALGMVASLGFEVGPICAAARAGITRARELEGFPVATLSGGITLSAIGHQIPEITRGFEGSARILRILQAGLVDLQREISVPLPKGRVHFYIGLPDPARCAALPPGLNSDTEHSARPDLDGQVPDLDGSRRLLETAVRLSGWAIEPVLSFVASGHTAAVEALARASDDLRIGHARLAIVGGVDSLLDDATLTWLAAGQRLKTPDVAAGLQPGEAGAFLLLEIAEHAIKCGRRPLARLGTIDTARDPAPYLSGKPAMGRGIKEVLAKIAPMAGQPTWLVTDQNGEPFRALDWGYALVGLLAETRALEDAMLWYPAASFGDTGAASGAVGACLAIRAFVRDYAPTSTAVVLSTADGGRRAAAILQREF